MPTTKQSHNENIKILCSLCLRKGQTRMVNDKQCDLIRDHIFSGYRGRHQQVLPSAICDGCRQRLVALEKPADGCSLPPRLKYEQMLPNDTKARPGPCNCDLCRLGSSFSPHGGMPSLYATAQVPSKGHPREAPTQENIKVCSHCFSTFARGKPHVCTKESRPNNLLVNLSPASKEHLASATIREKAGSAGTSNLALSSIKGAPLRVVSKGARKKLMCQEEVVSHRAMLSLQSTLNLSPRKTNKAADILLSELSS